MTSANNSGERYRAKPGAAGGWNARETACGIIREKIINLDLKPGESISDKQLAEEMEMSRTPVREALIILSTYEMVVLRPQTGTFVAPIDVGRMETEQFARYALEKEIVSEICGKLSDEHKWKYEENLRSYRHYAEAGDPDGGRNLLRLDNEFHRIAFEAAGRENNFLLLYNQLQHIERMRMLSLQFKDQKINLEDHTELYQAIASGDRARAMKRLKVHLGRYQENLATVQERYPDYFSYNT